MGIYLQKRVETDSIYVYTSGPLIRRWLLVLGWVAPIWSQIKHISVPTLFCFSPLHPCSVPTTAGGVSGVGGGAYRILPGDPSAKHVVQILSRWRKAVAQIRYFGD